MNVRRWWPPVAWAVLVLVLNTIPGGALPTTPSGADKGAHLLLDGVLGVLGARAALTAARGWRPLLSVLLASSAFGAVDELHQSLVPGRSVDWRDWIANVVGAALGVLLAAALMQRPDPHA